MKKTVAFILAGGVGKRLSLLTRFRAKPAVPFAGRYRIIDFTLTNCVRSGIDEVYVLTQYISRSLARHIGIGKPWDLDRMTGGLHVLHPHLGYQAADWYRGTADAMYQNISVIKRIACENILILSGDHVYLMDYRKFMTFHEEKGKPVSMSVVKVPRALTREFGIAFVDRKGNVTKFEEKPDESGSNLASMGIYIFNKEYLLSLLKELETEYSDLDFGRHAMPYIVSRGEVSAYRFPGYWLDIGTLKSYYTASLGLLADKPRLKLYSGSSAVLTVPDDSPPFVVTNEAHVSNSLICNGCLIRGDVRSSILSSGVMIENGARVENSILFHDCTIGAGAVVRNAIIDKGALIGPHANVGSGDPRVPNGLFPAYLDFGITIVGKKTVIPGSIRIGTNCLVSGTLDKGLIPRRDIADGASYIASDARL
ncbi:MAG: glucose-1-phosphate adenylyltransferase subunit GlgD [Candidatus Krumholzibacteria bacterium]|nr:glucose-1-phosphate adenylyltransferase subunit GlgD [Candidatus Krumholzibacteria bacterium]